jgi:hypothetical protein
MALVGINLILRHRSNRLLDLHDKLRYSYRGSKDSQLYPRNTSPTQTCSHAEKNNDEKDNSSFKECTHFTQGEIPGSIPPSYQCEQSRLTVSSKRSSRSNYSSDHLPNLSPSMITKIPAEKDGKIDGRQSFFKQGSNTLGQLRQYSGPFPYSSSDLPNFVFTELEVKNDHTHLVARPESACLTSSLKLEV